MPNKDHYLVLKARRHRNMNAILLQQHLRSATGTTVSTHDCPKPAPWCRSVCSSTDGVFSSGGTVAVGIILRSCTKVSDLAVGECWCMVAFSIGGRTDLYIIRDGSLTARRYRDEIFRPIVVP
ncbi:hypothetical protein TNCV_3103571 [Trichonephila clavipes]|nr:hypothetical protein TNCV_3103571 [Trichonephila clavipes]